MLLITDDNMHFAEVTSLAARAHVFVYSATTCHVLMLTHLHGYDNTCCAQIMKRFPELAADSTQVNAPSDTVTTTASTNTGKQLGDSNVTAAAAGATSDDSSTQQQHRQV
jgi:hypothetical protein